MLVKCLAACTSTFNRFPVIQAVKSKGRHFSTFYFFAHFGLPWVCPWDDRCKCHMDRKKIQCLSNASQHVSIYLQPFMRYSEISVASVFYHILLSLASPWDNGGKCHTVGKRIQCLSNASQHVPIYLQPFLRYSKLLVENCHIFIPHLCLAAPRGWSRPNFAKILIYTKLEWMGYRVDLNQTMWNPSITFRDILLTDNQTDGRTDRQTVAGYSVMLTKAQFTPKPPPFFASSSSSSSSSSSVISERRS